MDLKAVSYLQLYSQSKAFEEITGKQLDTPVLNVYMKMWNNRLDADSNDYKLYVAKKDKLILGFVYCRFIKCQGKIYALIKALYVNPTHWGLGIGRGLLDKLFAEIDNTSKNTRLGKGGKSTDTWDITGLPSGTYDVYVNAAYSAGNGRSLSQS